MDDKPKANKPLPESIKMLKKTLKKLEADFKRSMEETDSIIKQLKDHQKKNKTKA